MRVLLLPALLVAVALAGCVAEEACPRPATRATVTETGGGSLRVQLADGSPAVLHLNGSQLLRREGDGTCAATTLDRVGIGQTVSFDVDAWAESYPMQGWPKVVVVEAVP